MVMIMKQLIISSSNKDFAGRAAQSSQSNLLKE